MAANESMATLPLATFPEHPRQWESDRTAMWTVGHNIYALAKGATARDVRDQLDAQRQRLNALVAVSTTSEPFHCLNDDLKTNYLGACESLAEEISALIEIEAQPAAPAEPAVDGARDAYGSLPPAINIADARSASNQTREMLGQVYSLVSLAKTRAGTTAEVDDSLVSVLDHVMEIVGEEAAQNALETALGMTNAGTWEPLS